VQAPVEYIRKHYGRYDTKNPDTKDARRKRYLAAVTSMDEAIGEMLDLLDRLDLAEDTLVIFLSDNGGSGIADNAPLRGGKSQMFEGGLRVPCILRWPGVVPPGRTCREFLTSLEILPTVCRAAGVQPPAGVILDGFDMTAVLTGQRRSPRKEMFWQRRADRGARVGNWKWVESSRGGGLFDLAADLGERHDRSKDRPDVLERVKARFAAWKKRMDEAEPRRPFRDF